MIYVFLADGFEEVEALTPIDILRRSGAELKTVGIGKREITAAHGVTVLADITDKDVVLSEDIDMIVLPGGMPGTLNLEKSETVQAAIDYCVDNRKYVSAICAAPSILGHKGLLSGKKAVCYKGFEEQLTGAEIAKEAVIVSDIFITSKGAGTAMDFALKLVEVLYSREKSDNLAASVMIGQ